MCFHVLDIYNISWPMVLKIPRRWSKMNHPATSKFRGLRVTIWINGKKEFFFALNNSSIKDSMSMNRIDQQQKLPNMTEHEIAAAAAADMHIDTETSPSSYLPTCKYCVW